MTHTLPCVLLLVTAASAAVVRIEVREEARSVGYRRVLAKVHYAVDPRLPSNAAFADIDRAPLNAQGLVEFAADLEMLEPEKPAGRLLLEIPNRGRGSMLQVFNRGDKLLLEHGFTLAWVGWQPDVAPRDGSLRLHAPAARDVTGLVRTDYIPERGVTFFGLADSGHLPYTVAGGSRTLTVRDSIAGARRTIPAGQWQITEGRVKMAAGFEPGRIYEVVYTARDPWIAGLGFAAVRDLVSFLKSESKIEHAYSFGNSQSAMFLRAFVDEGFNKDERGKRVLDGILANVAGGRRVNLNRRFAQPSRTAGPYRAFFSRTDVPAFTDRDILSRAGEAPKIIHTNSAYEYWGAAASLTHTVSDGSTDVPPADTSRIYMFAGGQHGPSQFPPSRGRTRNLTNPNDYRWALRALLAALVRWVESGTPPPASRYPTIASRSLVPLADLKFPQIPGVTPPPRVHTPQRLLDDGEPPKLGPAYRTLVPAVDSDGNDRAGVRMPEIEAPLATYTGWNLTTSGELTNNSGSFLPFPRTRADRESSGDPRPSIEERYPNLDAYVARYRSAAERLVSDGFLLERDVAPLVEHAQRLWQYATAATVSGVAPAASSAEVRPTQP